MLPLIIRSIKFNKKSFLVPKKYYLVPEKQFMGAVKYYSDAKCRHYSPDQSVCCSVGTMYMRKQDASQIDLSEMVGSH